MINYIIGYMYLNYDGLELLAHSGSELASDTVIPLDVRRDRPVTRPRSGGVNIAQLHAVRATSVPPTESKLLSLYLDGSRLRPSLRLNVRLCACV
jgi:hypothetical protein